MTAASRRDSGEHIATEEHKYGNASGENYGTKVRGGYNGFCLRLAASHDESVFSVGTIQCDISWQRL
jgi:hypothetical protein